MSQPMPLAGVCAALDRFQEQQVLHLCPKALRFAVRVHLMERWLVARGFLVPSKRRRGRR
jgi:hypothetical protein